jgi:hypothetical protein
MKRWVAERTTQALIDGDVWRDEDVAMVWQRYGFEGFSNEEAKKKARTMLVGMIMQEAWGWFERDQDHTALNMYTRGAQQIAEREADEYRHPQTGVVYRLRKEG